MSRGGRLDLAADGSALAADGSASRPTDRPGGERLGLAADGAPESLYYFTGQLYPDIGPKAKRKGTQAVTVSSERLTEDAGWTEVPANQIIVLRRDRAPQFVHALTGKLVARERAPQASASGT